MRLISARQAWHDAFYESRSSVLAVAADKAALGKKGRVANETHPDRKDTNGRSAHMLAAGLVQAAIRSLPKPLQHFGHTLYSPLANGDDVAIAHGLVWIGSGLGQLTQRQGERAYWMALAAINSHKRAVNGRDTLRPGEVCLFIEERLGCRIDPSHWARDYASTWERLARHVDKLDAQALRPVAEVVAKQCGLRRGQAGAGTRSTAMWRRCSAPRPTPSAGSITSSAWRNVCAGCRTRSWRGGRRG